MKRFMLVTAAALPLVHKRQVIRQLEPQLAEARQQAEAAQALRKKLEALRVQSHFLVEKKRGSLLVVEVLNDITHILPDDTWLNTLDIRNNEVQIRGESSGAALLIPLIESSRVLSNARFRSPVTQNPQGGERFHLSADIRREAGS